MHPKMLKAMKAKRKRAVDPDAPPRPNLLTHDKKLRDMTTTAEKAMRDIVDLHDRVRKLERKLSSQTDYLNMVHTRLSRKNS